MSDEFGDRGADGDEMSRPHLFSDATADYLLAGGEVDDPAVQDLAQVLAAASAPGRAEELSQEDAAVAAFRTAHLATAHSHRRRPRSRPVWASALGLKMAAVALAVAVGGVAVAASTGVLPTPLSPVSSATAPQPRPTVQTGPARPSDASAPAPTPGPLKTAGPQLVGWCNAYLNAGSAEEKNKRLTDDLIAAAGGADKVTDYCVALVGSPKAKPSKAAKPSKSPRRSGAKPKPSH